MGEELYVVDRNEWRNWLSKNCASKKEVWLIYFKKHTGKPSIPYEDSVEEALCFGWIDGIIKRVDDEKCARKLMPRKSRSKWSESNKRRVEKIMGEGRMTEAGMAKIEDAKKTGEWYKFHMRPKELVVPVFIEEALRKKQKAYENFNGLGISFRKMYVTWISSAKLEETRMRRLAVAIGLLEQNKKLGLK